MIGDHFARRLILLDANPIKTMMQVMRLKTHLNL